MIDEKEIEIKDWDSKINDMTADFANMLKSTLSNMQDRINKGITDAEENDQMNK